MTSEPKLPPEQVLCICGHGVESHDDETGECMRLECGCTAYEEPDDIPDGREEDG